MTDHIDREFTALTLELAAAKQRIAELEAERQWQPIDTVMSKIPQEAIERAKTIADAIEAADWSDVSIGNKAILKSAIIALRADAARAQGVEAEPMAWIHPNGAIWRNDNYPAGMDFSKNGWEALYKRPPAPQPADREKVLEEALRPFAERADRYNEIPGLIQFADNDELWQVAKNKGMEIDITVGDLRRARAALAGEANG